MKIGIDLRSIDFSGGGGISNYTSSLCVNLFNLDTINQYKLFISGASLDKQALSIFDFPNVEIKEINIPNKILNSSIKFFKFPKLDQTTGDVDIFFSPNILFTSLSKNCKHVICCHDLSFLFFPEFLSHKRRLWHKLVEAKKLYKNADKIIAVSENTKHDLMNELDIPENKIKVIYSGINKPNEISDQKINKILEKYKIPENFFLTLSVIEPRKNIESIIKVCNKLGVNLVIAGRRGWKCDKKIKFIENITEEEKQVLLKNCKAFIFPSFYEGFGFPPLEAMAAGAPVIASATSSLSEICGDKAILVDPYNLEELEKAIKHIKTNSYQNNNQDITEEFSWEKTAKKTLELFESLNN